MKLHEDVQAIEDESQTGTGTEALETEAEYAGPGSFDFDVVGPDAGTPDQEDEETFEAYMRRLYEDGKLGSTNAEEDQAPSRRQEVGPEGTIKDTGGTCCIVHTNGVHHLPLLTCGCRGPEDVFLDLANARFVPTSFSRISTLFTAAVLDDFRLSNLECKVSAYQYWQRLSRLTRPLNPTTVSNRYKELLRMSRLWRWMKKLKWAGVGHNQQTSEQPKNGELSIFCPACPQPGINIPADWKDDPKRYAIDCCPWCRS